MGACDLSNKGGKNIYWIFTFSGMVLHLDFTFINPYDSLMN